MPVPRLIVISAPSGCGKTTIAREVLRRHPDMVFSVSATTRPKRDNEVDGTDYFFLTNAEFEGRIRRGELVEWERIYDHYYGTLHSEVDRALRAGMSMVFDIDVNGALSIKNKYPDNALLIFIRPPDFEVLRQRLVNRRTESEEIVRKRLDRVPMEMEKGKLFDHCVVNDDLQKAFSDVDALVTAAIR
jgi:guanylate kinase